MNSDRKLFIAVVLGSLVFAMGVSQWAVQPMISASERVSFTYPNYVPALTLFWSIVIGGVLLYLHPRYGGLYPAYQLALSFVVFVVASNIPNLALAANNDLPESAKDTISYTIIVLLLILFNLYFLLIPLLFRQKRYALVHRTLDIMQRVRPRNANLYITRGQTYFAQKQPEKAVEAADRAIALTPSLKKKADEGWLSFKDWRLIRAHQLRMSAYFELDQRDMASEDAEVIVRLNPHDPTSYMYRGIVATHRGEFDAANADFEHASQLKMGAYPQAYLVGAQGDLAYRQHKNDEAKSLYQTSLAIPLNAAQRLAFHPAVYTMLGLIELREGHLETAQELCQQSQSINPEFKSIGLALLYAHKGLWDDAVAQWRLVMTKSPRYGSMDSIRRMYQPDPVFVDLFEQIIAHSETVAA